MCGGGNPVRDFVGTNVTHLEDVGKAYRKDPERPLLGINNPIESKLWGGLTGKDYAPTIQQFGQPTQTSYNRAASKGYSTGPTEASHNAAAALATYFGGSAALNALGGAGAGSSGVDTTYTNADGTTYAGGEYPGTTYEELYAGSQQPAAAGSQMPPAQPESPETLRSQGLTEVSPGVWQQAPSGVGPGALQAMNVDTGVPQQQSQVQSAQPTQPAATQGGGAGGQTAAATKAPAGQQADPNASFVDRVLAQMKGNPLATVGLGLTAANMATNAQRKTPPAVQQSSEISNEARATANQLLAQYRSGQLSQGQQATLDERSRNARNQINQYFASIGQADSTAHRQALAQVDQEAFTMKQQMLDSALSNGMNALGIAAGPLQNVIQYELGQDKALRDAFANFAGSMGTFGGRQAGAQAQPAQPMASQPTQVVQSNQQPPS